MTSLRRRLTLFVVLACVLALGAVGLVHRSTVRRALQSQLDAGLTDKARALGALLEQDETGLEFDFSGELMPEYEPGKAAEYFELWGTDGSVLERSESLGPAGLPRRAGGFLQPLPFDLTLPDGRPGRAVGLLAAVDIDDELPDVPLADRQRVTVVVARSRADLDHTLATLDGSLALAGLAGLLAIGLLVAWAVRRGLGPLERLAAEVAAIDADSLSARVDGTGAPAELAGLVARLNDLLARLQEAFARQRRMTAAVAHELRTPIAELRAAVDVARRWPADPDLGEQLSTIAADVAEHMGRQVDAVLHLARIDGGQERVAVTRVPLADLVARLWRGCESRARERGLAFVDAVPADAAVLTDPDLLGVALGNLLDNATSFCAPQGTIRVVLHERGDELELAIDNPAPDLAPADLPHLTEPFWRKDAARTAGSHSGLGLRLVASVVELLGARLELDLEDGRLTARVAGLRRCGPEPDRAVRPESRAAVRPRSAR